MSIEQSLYKGMVLRIEQLEKQLADAQKPISDEQVDNIIYQCDGFLKWGVGDHGKQTIREKIRAIIKDQSC